MYSAIYMFSLLNDPWIPVRGASRISLRQVFSPPIGGSLPYQALSGTPVQKIAVTKLLQAIAQAACTPEDESAWRTMGPEGMALQCVAYLERWADRLYLYGDRPFLQMPAIAIAKTQPLGALQPEISTGSSTILTQSQVEKKLDDGERALLIVQLATGFGLGGKKADSKVVLTSDYQGKKAAGKAGAAIGSFGFLHNFLLGDSVLESVWLNLFDQQQLAGLLMYSGGRGIPPWERMPLGEDDDIARALKTSLIGRLVPLSHFCLLNGDTVHYSEGIVHPGPAEGMVDPSTSFAVTAKGLKPLWVDAEKRPWRALPALLSFFSHLDNKSFDCLQLRLTVARAAQLRPMLTLWSGGLRVSSNAGEQYVSGTDDFVESNLTLLSSFLGESWFANLQLEMRELEQLSKISYSATLAYFKSQNKTAEQQARRASNLFWQLCEREVPGLVAACAAPELTLALRPKFAQLVHQVYDSLCPRGSARQFDAWAENQPNLTKYFRNYTKGRGV
jgi:CRISPR system Cascade subunit CasA